MRHLLLASTLLLAGCNMNMVNLNVEPFPDGSGHVSTIRLDVPDSPTPEQKAFAGLHDLEGFRLEMTGGHFKSLDALDLGGITLSMEALPAGHLVRVHVPTTSNAKWFRHLGPSKAKCERLEAMMRRDREISGPGNETEVSLDLEKPEFVLEVEMPGEVKESRLVDLELPAGWKLENEDSDRKARLHIPLAAIRAGTIDHVVWEVTSGAITKKAQENWDKTRRALALPPK